MAELTTNSPGASAHPNLDLDALEALWALLEESHDAHVGARIDGFEGGHPRCRVESDPLLEGQVIELARVELYRRLVAAHAPIVSPWVRRALANDLPVKPRGATGPAEETGSDDPGERDQLASGWQRFKPAPASWASYSERERAELVADLRRLGVSHG